MNKFLVGFCLLFTSAFAQVDDPFLWLEDENSSEAKEWVRNQQKKTDYYFSEADDRENLREALIKATYFDRYGLPEIRPNGLFLMKSDKDADRASLVFVSENEEILLPPLSENGAVYSGFQVSKEGKKIAFGISKGGGDSREWSLFDTVSKEHLPDLLLGIKYSQPLFSQDGNSLYYVREGNQLYEHKIGTNQEEDTLLYQTPEREEGLLQLCDLGQKENYLILSFCRASDASNAIFLWDIKEKQMLSCIAEGIGTNAYVGEIDDKLLFITDAGAPFRKLTALDAKHSWTTLVEEKNRLLESSAICGDKIVAVFYEAAVAKLKVYKSNGELIKEICLPGLGSVDVAANPDFPFFFYCYTDFHTPPTLVRVDLDNNVEENFFTPKIEKSDFTTQQVWFKSHDGTNVPLFLCRKNGIELTKNTHVLLYGYGGFDYAVTPHFSSFFLVWMEQGGALAVANVRGGNEFGKAWYDAGRLRNKKNSFYDFISAAEWLTAHHIGSAQTLAIHGQSNGGLLVGACLTMRPELFGAALVEKGVLDMLRFHLFSIGYMWKSDYGDPDSPEDYAYLLSYSPYHNVKALTAYPATLILTADHDDRVVPAHSFKFAGALQAAQNGNKPVLLRIQQDEGHGGGSSRSHILSSHLDKLLFLKKELN